MLNYSLIAAAINQTAHSEHSWITPVLPIIGVIWVRKLISHFRIKAFLSPVESLPSFPITLKPYIFVISFSYLVSFIFFVIGVYCASLSERMLCLSILIFIFSLYIIYDTYRLSKSTIRLENDNVIYSISNKEYLMNSEALNSLKLNKQTGNLEVILKGQEKPLKIPLLFKDMNYLAKVLNDWGHRSL